MPAPRENCPECGESIPAPGGAHGLPGQMHSQRDCPKCGTPLIWWTDGYFADKGWTEDDAEQRRQRLAAEDD